MDSTLIKEIVEYFEFGYTPVKVADLAGISLEELAELCESNRFIKSAKKHGIEKLNHRVVKALLQAATGYKTTDKTIEKRFAKDQKTIAFKSEIESIREYGPNVSAIKYWLENKDKGEWSTLFDKVEKDANITIKLVDGKDIEIKTDSE